MTQEAHKTPGKHRDGNGGTLGALRTTWRSNAGADEQTAVLIFFLFLQQAGELQKQTKRSREPEGFGAPRQRSSTLGALKTACGDVDGTIKGQKSLGTPKRALEELQNQRSDMHKRSPVSVLSPLALASRLRLNFTVYKCPKRIPLLSVLWKGNIPVSTLILQWLVSDKTFPNPLIYQMANPVNSLRNIITCNLFCYSFYAYTSLLLAAYQQARRELKQGCSHRAFQQCNFP